MRHLLTPFALQVHYTHNNLILIDCEMVKGLYIK